MVKAAKKKSSRFNTNLIVSSAEDAKGTKTNSNEEQVTENREQKDSKATAITRRLSPINAKTGITSRC